jgi:hypothetical protein
MFPRGAPGFALLLLRVCVATSLLSSIGGGPHSVAWSLALTVTLIIALGVGFMTPIAALLTIPVYLIETAGLRVVPAEVITAIVPAVALSLIGPGSYSIDAYLFGHRVVVIPKTHDRDAD